MFAAFLAVAVVLAITPGPGIAYVVARTVAGGRAEGLASCFGTGVGGMLHVGAAALGLSLIVAQSALAFRACSRQMREMRWAAMRMPARRAARRRVAPLRKPPDKAGAAFRPNPSGRPMAGALRRCRFACWHQPTALAAPRTASRH
jgi:hypothetical protein